MPKEYINARDFGKKFPIVGGGRSSPYVDHTSARIGWSRESQGVAVTVVDFAKDPDGQSEGTQYLNLDRHGINSLIRTLRKARDQAFGADA